MIETPDNLDRLLAEADRARTGQGSLPDGARIRQLADQRGRQRRARSVALSGLIVACLAIGISWWSGSPVGGERFDADAALAELEQIRIEQRQLEDELKLQRVERRLELVEQSMARLEKLDTVTGGNFRQNRDAWLALRRLTANRTEIVEGDRWQLELLANGCPRTSAGNLARNILNTNHLPENWMEKIDEL